MSEKKLLISIVIPSYNNSDIFDKNAPVLIDHLQKKNYNYEIILVNDGSTHDTKGKEIAAKYGCHYVSYENNKGKGYAVRTGMNKAAGDIKLFTDTDIPFEMDAIDHIIHYLTVKEYDMVIGDRTLKESSYFTEISASRKLGSSVFTFFVGRFVTTGMFDTQCGLKAFKREVADDLFGVARINSFAFDVELVYIALKRNYDIKRLAVRLRNSEGNSVSLLKHSFKMMLDVFQIKINNMNGKYIKK
jgi:dolichyl-phosphate beta-glucosyltransferase